MKKLLLKDVECSGKRVLMRVDFNVPLDSERNVADATRIEAALPSIEYVLEQGGSLVLMSHLGRPRAEPMPELSLKPVVKVVEALLKREVKLAPNCVGEEVQEMVEALKPGEVLMLENLRFHRAETHPDEAPEFAEELASFGDVYVNDAFGTAHRKHSSTYTVATHFAGQAAAGFLLEKEIHFLGELLEDPKRPFYALLGGAKVSTKIGVIRALLEKADRLLIGGAMSYTFQAAKGMSVANSLVEKDLIPLAEELLKEHSDQIVLPLDALIASECSENAAAKVCDFSEGGIPEGHEGLDIGPKTIELFSQILGGAKTVLWNGPVGVYEFDRFAHGTKALADRVAQIEAVTIVGGGDLVAAIGQAGVSEKITHISTGGGATLEFLEKGTLPCIDVLSTKLAV